MTLRHEFVSFAFFLCIVRGRQTVHTFGLLERERHLSPKATQVMVKLPPQRGVRL